MAVAIAPAPTGLARLMAVNQLEVVVVDETRRASALSLEAILPEKNFGVLSRRSLLLTSIGIFVPLARAAWGQSNYSPMLPAFDAALEIRNFAEEISPEDADPTIYLKYQQADLNARLTTIQLAQEHQFLSDEKSAFEYVDAIPDFLPPDFPIRYDSVALESQKLAIGTIVAESIPIVPSADRLVYAEIAVLPTESTPAQVTGVNGDLIVAGDIFLETLGIVADESLVVELIESDDNWKLKLEEFLQQVTTKQWDEVIETAEDIFKLFIGSKIWEATAKQIGKKFTFRLALRCVPIVGWVYFGAAFVVSVKKNWNRFSFAQ